MLCAEISIWSMISLCALIQSRFPLVALNCVHILLSCKKRQEQKQQPWTTPSVYSSFSGGSDEKLPATGENKGGVEPIL